MGRTFSKKLLTVDDADDVVLLSVAAPHVDEHEARRLEELQAVRGPSENATKLAQTLGQLQPFIPVLCSHRKAWAIGAC